jgi:hypothetical protein
MYEIQFRIKTIQIACIEDGILSLIHRIESPVAAMCSEHWSNCIDLIIVIVVRIAITSNKAIIPIFPTIELIEITIR